MFASMFDDIIYISDFIDIRIEKIFGVKFIFENNIYK
jgi:hypothetical protein